MTQRFYDHDANPEVLAGKTVAVIGFGNQGRSQALNMVDSGLQVIVGNREDEYRHQAEEDGFQVYAIAEAVSRADIIFVILPDEVQREIFDTSIEPHLKPGDTVVFSHGYNIHFGLIRPPVLIDVVLVAPKMIGEGVRDTYVDGRGFSSLVAIAQDASGHALDTALALAHAIGGTRRGAWLSSFEEETVTDLFGEQVGGAAQLGSLMLAFETLVEAGYDPEVIQLEMYGSGELVEVMKAIHRYGLLNSLSLHSPTSQYGQMSRVPRLVPSEARETLREVLENIRSGEFAREWASVQEHDYAEMEVLRRRYAEHPLFKAEASVREATSGTREVAESQA